MIAISIRMLIPILFLKNNFQVFIHKVTVLSVKGGKDQQKWDSLKSSREVVEFSYIAVARVIVKGMIKVKITMTWAIVFGRVRY